MVKTFHEKKSNLSMRKTEMSLGARKASKLNPFKIFDFFDQLKKIYYEHSDLDESKSFNCDGTGFPTEQNREKFISFKVKCVFKPLLSARRENILFWVYVVPAD